jgi:hypothetical protein
MAKNHPYYGLGSGTSPIVWVAVTHTMGDTTEMSPIVWVALTHTIGRFTNMLPIVWVNVTHTMGGGVCPDPYYG